MDFLFIFNIPVYLLKKYNIPIVFTIHDYRIVCPAYSFRNGKDEVCEKCQGKHFYRCVTNRCTKGSYFLSIFMAAEQYYRNKFFNPAKYIDGLLYVSNFAKGKHEKYMPALKELPNIVLHNFSVSISEHRIPLKEKYFLFLGRLSQEKGIITLMNAFKNRPQDKLKIVGDGPLRNQLEAYKEQHGIKNIEFLGYKSGQELMDLKKNAYFVVVPSEWYENNPMAIIESYCEGVPAIGSRIGGIPEIINEGKTGYIFKPHNTTELTEKIAKASDLSAEVYQQMSDNAISFAHKDMSKESYYKRLLPFYEQLLNNKK